jgi:lipopolysaccharide export system permease protein
VKLAHRLIFKELAVTFTLSVSTLLGVLLMGRMIQLRELLMGHDLGFLDLMKLFFFMSPYFMLLIAPIACMLSVFLTFLRMSSDNELTALKAGGVSLYRLAPPVIFFCIACTAATYFISFHGISWGMNNFRSSVVEFARTKSRFAIQPGVFNRDFPNLTFYAKNTNPETGELMDLFVRDSTVEDAPVIIMAPYGKITTKPDEGIMEVAFRNGRIFRRGKGELNVLSFRNYTVRVPIAMLIGGKFFDSSRISEQSVATLQRMKNNPSEKLLRDENRWRKVHNELAKRYSLPFGCFVLGLFAMPVACVFRGLNQQYGLSLSLGLFLVYYTLFSIGSSLGESGVAPPTVLQWIPNVLFLVIGLVLLRYTNLERVPSVLERIMHIKARRAES